MFVPPSGWIVATVVEPRAARRVVGRRQRDGQASPCSSTSPARSDPRGPSRATSSRIARARARSCRRHRPRAVEDDDQVGRHAAPARRPRLAPGADHELHAREPSRPPRSTALRSSVPVNDTGRAGGAANAGLARARRRHGGLAAGDRPRQSRCRQRARRPISQRLRRTALLRTGSILSSPFVCGRPSSAHDQSARVDARRAEADW